MSQANENWRRTRRILTLPQASLCARGSHFQSFLGQLQLGSYLLARHRFRLFKGYPAVKVIMPAGEVKDPNGDPNPNCVSNSGIQGINLLE